MIINSVLITFQVVLSIATKKGPHRKVDFSWSLHRFELVTADLRSKDAGSEVRGTKPRAGVSTEHGCVEKPAGR